MPLLRYIFSTAYLMFLIFNFLEPSSLIDSEYAKAGILDPKIIITTSRDPSSRLLQFSKVCHFFWVVRRSIVVPPPLLMPPQFSRKCAWCFRMRIE